MNVTINKKQVNQDFFKDFNWSNFSHGDIVWLEDNNEVDLIAAYYQSSDDGINLVPLTNHEAQVAIKYNLDSVYPLFS